MKDTPEPARELSIWATANDEEIRVSVIDHVDYALGQAVDTQLSAMLPLLPVVNYCGT